MSESLTLFLLVYGVEFFQISGTHSRGYSFNCQILQQSAHFCRISLLLVKYLACRKFVCRISDLSTIQFANGRWIENNVRLGTITAIIFLAISFSLPCAAETGAENCLRIETVHEKGMAPTRADNSCVEYLDCQSFKGEGSVRGNQTSFVHFHRERTLHFLKAIHLC